MASQRGVEWATKQRFLKGSGNSTSLGAPGRSVDLCISVRYYTGLSGSFPNSCFTLATREKEEVYKRRIRIALSDVRSHAG